MLATFLVASSATTIAWVLVAVLTVGFLLFWLFNTAAARHELGSEIELAPNRKPYYDDETLEGSRLERMQILAVLLLVVMVVGLPLYWILEPSRQAGAKAKQADRFVAWGSALFETTANGGFNCAGCHGGMKATGGSAPYTYTDVKTGQVSALQWKAPALNTVFYRYSDDEVRFILQYGRPFSPMQAWGTVGGGPMNAQQIDTLISYLHFIQVPREGCAANEKDPLTCPSGHLPTDATDVARTQTQIAQAADQAAEALVKAGKYATKDEAMGEALFNLDLDSGAYSCARCHTRGWSIDQPGVSGQGAFGWNLTGGNTVAAFPNEADMITFVKNGSNYGQKYGTQGQGMGRMPGFGGLLTDAQVKAIVEYVRNHL